MILTLGPFTYSRPWTRRRTPNIPTDTGDTPFRMTPQREAVLSAVQSADTHPSAEEIYRIVQSTSPGIGVATVYRTLDLLVRHREVLQLRLPDESVTRYDANTSDHHHVICGVCGDVTDIDLELPAGLVATAAERSGVEITEYDLRLRGTCADCR